MTQEEKTLLLKDLCGRLLYGTMLNVTLIDKYDEVVNKDLELTEYNFTYITSYSHWKEYKPYLRYLSSMTDEEQRFISEKFNADKWASIETYSSSEDGIAEVFIEDIHGLIDWLDKKMFDYRGLIPKGLALEAPKGMYNN